MNNNTNNTKEGIRIAIDCKIAFPRLGFSEKDMEERATALQGKARKYSTNDKPNSVVILIPKTDKNSLSTIEKAMCDVAGVGAISDLIKHPLIDSEGVLKDGDLEELDGYKGCLYFHTSSKNHPIFKMLDTAGNPVDVQIEDARNVFYDGANVTVVLKASEFEPKKVTFFIEGLLLLDNEGTRIIRSSAKKDISNLIEQRAKEIAEAKGLPQTTLVSPVEEAMLGKNIKVTKVAEPASEPVETIERKPKLTTKASPSLTSLLDT